MRGREEQILVTPGEKYGRLTVLEKTYIGRSIGLRCICDCGNEATGLKHDIVNGKKVSCGCARRGAVRHDMCYSTEYTVWKNMLNRCRNPHNKCFKDYGGRGITFDDRWLIFENFYNDVGKRPSLDYSLERKNNDLGYNKDNVVWATRKTQMRNTRANTFITHDNKRLTLSEWSEITGMKRERISARIRLGWTIADALDPSKSRSNRRKLPDVNNITV